jgi:hypothetical protein
MTESDGKDVERKVSPVLLRIIEEIRLERAEYPRSVYAYDRYHNRHNRSLHPTPKPAPVRSPKPKQPAPPEK